MTQACQEIYKWYMSMAKFYYRGVGKDFFKISESVCVTLSKSVIPLVTFMIIESCKWFKKEMHWLSYYKIKEIMPFQKNQKMLLLKYYLNVL